MVINSNSSNRTASADILLIDDLSRDNEPLISILQNSGYQLRRENSVEAALSFIRIKKPDLILLASKINGSDGFEVCKRLKSKPSTNGIPVLILVEKAEHRVEILAFRFGGVDFIAKPFTKEDVLIRVNNSLELFFVSQGFEQAKQTLFDKNKKLSETEALFKAHREWLARILKSIGDGVISTDATGIITLMNESAAKLTGWTIGEATGKPVEDIFRIINESTREGIINSVRVAVETGRVNGLNQVLLISKAGQENRINAVITPYSQAQGSVAGSIIVMSGFSSEVDNLKAIKVESIQESIESQDNRRKTDRELNNGGTYMPYAFVITDVWGMELANNAFGYEYSDLLLKKINGIFKSECRPGDLVVRIGEEKFVILMPAPDALHADILIGRLNKAIEKAGIKSIEFALSAGVSFKDDVYIGKNGTVKKPANPSAKDRAAEHLSIMNRIIYIIMNKLFETEPALKLHSNMVGSVCEAIARQMNFSEDEIKQIKLAGIVHDIGKIGVDSEIIAAKSRLNDEAQKSYQRHSEIGYRILKPSKEFSPLAEYVLEHHERWDGEGYPRGLRGNDISLQARIISVADSYCNMVTKKVHGKEMLRDEAISGIKKGSGTQFDPEVVKALIQTEMTKGG
jgi:diguanylate cyclase